MFNHIQRTPKTGDSWEEVYEWFLGKVEELTRRPGRTNMTVRVNPNLAHDIKVMAYATGDGIAANPAFEEGEEVFATAFCDLRLEVANREPRRIMRFVHD